MDRPDQPINPSGFGKRIGTSLEETAQLPSLSEVAEHLAQQAQAAARPPAGTLSLHLMGEKLPLLLHKDKTILGRLESSPQKPAADLSRYYARVLGVSREHAAVSYADQGWVVEDLNSTNGTWLNKKKLTPHEPQVLRNGDMVRLGQLMMFVYFQ